MDDKPTRQETPSEQATLSRPSGYLLASALACVAWDGTVDVDGLASVEFAYDEAIVRRAVAMGATVMDSLGNGRPFMPRGIEIGGVDVGERWESEGFTAERHDGTWRIVTPQEDEIPIANEHLVLFGALCARHKLFTMTWSGVVQPSPVQEGSRIAWRNMWMSRIVGALAGASGAWTGDEIMRTQHLARALLDLLRARNAIDLLAAPIGPEIKKAPSESADAVKVARLREAIAVAASMPDAVHFCNDAPHATVITTYDADNATVLLEFVINAAQRVYETQSLYKAVIAPAEYEALCRNTPDGTFQ